MSTETLAGARVLISGSGRGLGAALAICLADAGCEVVITGRNRPALDSVANAILLRTGRAAQLHPLDLMQSDQIEATVEALSSRGGKLDVLINNGAAWLPAQPGPFTAAQVADAVGSAISGTFLLTQAALPLLLASDRADILTIGSTCSLQGAGLGATSVPFYAAKQGQRGLMEALAQTTAGTGVRVQCIHPPDLIDTSALNEIWDGTPSQSQAMATNRDVVEAVTFALSRPRHVRVASIILEAVDLTAVQPKRRDGGTESLPS